MNAISETFRILWLIFLWFGFSFMILVSLLSFIFGDWQWGALFLVASTIGLSAIDTVLKGGIGYESNGGLFHHFFIFVHSISAVGLILVTVLTAFGVLRTADAILWTPETNFASWYMAGGMFITYFLIQPTEPNDDIPDLRRMEQLDRRSARVGVVSAAIFTVLCLVVPLTSFMTAGYDPVALAVALFLAPGFLRVVREGLFYLQGPRFEEGSEGYRILRVVCVGVAGLAGCIALGYLGYSLVRLELLPALFFAASVAMNGWSVKKYVTVGISIPEEEEADSSSHASVQEAE